VRNPGFVLDSFEIHRCLISWTSHDPGGGEGRHTHGMVVVFSGTTPSKKGRTMTRHGHYTLGGENPPKSTYYEQGKFGRMFPMLPPFATDTPTVKDALKELGEKGGVMDAADKTDIAANPNLARDLITNPALSANNPDNPALTAGMTFLDHDMTFDPTSSLERQVDPEAIRNFRNPSLELDSMYGSGPRASPHLYDQSAGGQGIKFSSWQRSPAQRRSPRVVSLASTCPETAR
jgi:hypothetical protein